MARGLTDTTKHGEGCKAGKKAKGWYDLFHGKCPTCGVEATFKEIELPDIKIGGSLKVRGLSSGESLRY